MAAEAQRFSYVFVQYIPQHRKVFLKQGTKGHMVK